MFNLKKEKNIIQIPDQVKSEMALELGWNFLTSLCWVL